STHLKPQLVESLFKRDIAFLEKLDPCFPDIASDCYELSRLYIRQNRYAQSEVLLQRAVSIRQRWQDLQSDSPFNPVIFAALYIDYIFLGKTDLAVKARKQMFEHLQRLNTKSARAKCMSSLQRLFQEYVWEHKNLPPQQTKQYLLMAQAFSEQAAL